MIFLGKAHRNELHRIGIDRIVTEGDKGNVEAFAQKFKYLFAVEKTLANKYVTEVSAKVF